MDFEPMVRPDGREPLRKPMSGIYCIMCQPTGKVYIGSAFHLIQRKSEHRRLLCDGKHHNLYLQRAWDKYGKENFNYTILECCDVSLLANREQYYLDLYKAASRDNGYNILTIAKSPRGYKHSEESINKVRQKKLGVKLSAEVRENMSRSKMGIKLNLSEEQREARRQRMLGKQWSLGLKLSEERKEALRGNKYAFGNIFTEEQKDRLSLAHTSLSVDQCNKIRQEFSDNIKTVTALSIEYKKCRQTIKHIINRTLRAYR